MNEIISVHDQDGGSEVCASSMTPRELALEIKASMDAVPVDKMRDTHRSRRARLKTKLLKTIPREQLFEVKTLLENMLNSNKLKNGKDWGANHAAFFRSKSRAAR